MQARQHIEVVLQPDVECLALVGREAPGARRVGGSVAGRGLAAELDDAAMQAQCLLAAGRPCDARRHGKARGSSKHGSTQQMHGTLPVGSRPLIPQPGMSFLHSSRPQDMLGKEESSMTLGIIGIGAVGSATAMAAALRAPVREIGLIDRNHARAKAVAIDMHSGVAAPPMVSIRDGDYPDLADAGPAMTTARL